MKLFVTLIATLWMLAACNTMEGLGKDVKSAGDSLENAAKKNK